MLARTGLLLLAVGLAKGSAHAQLSWQIQSDYFGTRDTISQPRSLRGLALSADNANLYGGFIQGAGTSASIREVATNAPGQIIGNEPAPYGANPPYTNGLIARVTVANQPKGVAVDSRGYVCATLNSGSAANNQTWAIYNSNLTAQVGAYTSVAAAASQLAGICARKLGAHSYVYVARNGASAQIERWNITNPGAAALDTSWGGGTGKINLKTVWVDAYCNGLETDTDGTLYVAGGTNAATRGDSVFKVSSAAGASGELSSVAHASVPGAMDVALFQNRLYVTQYLTNSSSIAVLNKSDLSFVQTLVTDPRGNYNSDAGADAGYSGIDISQDGRIYVVEQCYNYVKTTGSYTPPGGVPMTGTRIYFDRILVSSRLPDLVPPEITCPTNLIVNPDPGSWSATVDPGAATAVDDVDGVLTAAGTRDDGSALTDPYPVGLTIITWSATDSSGNSSTCSQTVTVLGDTIGDGIPNWWRQTFFGDGSTTNEVSCAACDPDGDGFSNLQEYLAGTNPTNSASALRIKSVAVQGADVVITWTTAGKRTNAVQATGGDADGGYTTNFLDITTSPHLIIPGSGDVTTSYSDLGGTTKGPSRFYRIRLVP
jgi:hypothetical protein